MTMQQATDGGIEDRAPLRKPTWLRVVVVDDAKGGRPAVNVKIPVGMVKWGMKMARTFAPEMNDADLDWDSIAAMIEEGARGEIVSVEDEEHRKTIEVWVE